jgi:hypothetical protein
LHALTQAIVRFSFFLHIDLPGMTDFLALLAGE